MAVVPFFSIFALCVMPIAFMAYGSMARWIDLQRIGWGTSDGYLRILRPDVLGPLGEITFRAGLTATLDIALAIPIADCLIRLKPSLRAVILVILTIPFVVSPTSRAFGWFQILNQGGYLNGLIHSIAPSAAPVTWLLYNRGSVIVTLVAATLSFSVFPIVLTLPSGRSNLWRACSDMGTSYFVRLRRLTIPLGLRGIAIGWLCVFWLAFGSSVEASVVDGPTELSIGRIINGLLSAGEFAAASALGVCIAAAFGLSSGAAYILLNRVKRSQRTQTAATDNKRDVPFTSHLTKNLGHKEITSGSARSRAVMRAAKFAVGSLFIGLVLVYVLAPVGAVIAMSLTHVSDVNAANLTLRYYFSAFQSGPIKDAWITSLLVAIPVGLSCGILSFACGLSWLNKRSRNAVICAMAILALLPPDVYVLGLLSLARSLGSRQASLVWVALAQTAGALPFCTAIIFAVNSAFDPFLLNVGRELGASRLRLLYSVLFRLTWQAVASAFLTAILLSLNDYTRVSYLSGSVQFLTLYIYGRMKSGTDPTVYAVGSINAIAAILLFFLALLIVKFSDSNRTRSQR